MPDSGNICKFSSVPDDTNDLFAFQFIYETNATRLGINRSYSAFVCHIVAAGSATFHTATGSFSLSEGDLFFVFPSSVFTLECDESFQYLYIAFIGNHASELLASMEITRENPVRNGYGDLTDIWYKALRRCHSENLAYMAKGVLYGTFACLMKSKSDQKAAGGCDNIVAQIREVIERDYSDPALSLDALCRQYRYHTKYISRRFRELVGISFSEYLTSCRMRQASILLLETTMTVREISAAVGYRDALYFSKVFKRASGVSPCQYRVREKELQKKQ